jgi:hypothetical protein
MEFEMLDLPLPSIKILKQYEKDYLTSNLKSIYDDCKSVFELDREKHYNRMRTHDTTKGDDFIGTSSYFISAYNFKKMKERFKYLLNNIWDWEAYFTNLDIEDFYVRLFFIQL